MRTQDEIVARLRAPRGDLLFNFEPDVLLPQLDFDRAREFLKDGATAEEWGRATDGVEERYPLGEAAALRDFRSYAAFAWSKARYHRGLSAIRSVQKLSAWAWLLGRDDVLEAVERADYAPYGCPKLKVICEAFGFPVPDDEELVRMMRGEPCTPDCEDGCNS